MEDKQNEKIDSSSVETLPKNVISIDEGVIREHLNQVVTCIVEETLNALLEAEADRFCVEPDDTSTERIGWTRESDTTRAIHKH